MNEPVDVVSEYLRSGALVVCAVLAVLCLANGVSSIDRSITKALISTVPHGAEKVAPIRSRENMSDAFDRRYLRVPAECI